MHHDEEAYKAMEDIANARGDKEALDAIRVLRKYPFEDVIRACMQRFKAAAQAAQSEEAAKQ